MASLKVADVLAMTGDGLEECWATVWDRFGVISTTPYETVLESRSMPGAQWFAGARLNYAEHIGRMAADRPDDIAVVGVSQSRERLELSWGELVEQVRRARAGLVRLGVGEGDRVAAYLPNVPETIVAFLAASSLGAIWTSCAPEFGVQAVLDRFRQVEPTVLLAVDGYRYGRRDVSRVDELAAIRVGLPSLAATVHVPYLPGTPPTDTVGWDELLADDPAPLEFLADGLLIRLPVLGKLVEEPLVLAPVRSVQLEFDPHLMPQEDQGQRGAGNADAGVQPVIARRGDVLPSLQAGAAERLQGLLPELEPHLVAPLLGALS